jgi:GAF domain/ANTAR domain
MASQRVGRILSAVVVEASDDGHLATVLVDLCARSLPVSGVGLAVMTDDGHRETVAASDRPAMTLEELQFTLGEGPCVDASRTGRPSLVPDLDSTAPRRWPAFADGAHAAGLRAVFALPLRVGGIRVGVLDLYRDVAGPLPLDDLYDALAFADAATALLLHLQAGAPSADLTRDPHTALDDRATVHQATGVLAVRAGVGLEQALVLLRARAWAEQRPIGAVALDVLDGAVDLEEGDRSAGGLDR